MYLRHRTGPQHLSWHHAGGQAVVLVHGWGACNTLLGHHRARVVGRRPREVVSLDLRACGRSDKDFDDVSIDALAGDVVNWSTTCRTGRRSTAGRSVAAWHCGRCRTRRSGGRSGADRRGVTAVHRCRRLGPRRHSGGVAEVLAACANRADTFRGVAAAVCAKAPSDDTLNWIWGMFMEMGPRGDESLRDLSHMDPRTELAAIDVPILSLHGTGGRIRDPG